MRMTLSAEDKAVHIYASLAQSAVLILNITIHVWTCMYRLTNRIDEHGCLISEEQVNDGLDMAHRHT